jgi:predicted membrane protein
MEDRRRRWEDRIERHHGAGQVWAGLFLLIIGGLALARSFGVPMPVWLFTWQMLLVGIGLLIGFKKGFRDGGWFIPIIIGGAFLVNDYFLHGELRRHIWPLVLIVIGMFFIFRPRRKRRHGWHEKKSAGVQAETITPLSKEDYSKDDFIDSTCIFSGAKKVVLSKNFKGGDITNIFGGCELDLTQADMTEPAVMDITAVFGGATLIIPSNWAIKSDAVTIFGGISDKRKFPKAPEAAAKTLKLDGTIIFGGVEIRSY